MPYKIDINNENEKIFQQVIKLYFEKRKTYEEIGFVLNRSKDYIYNLVKTFKSKYNINKVISFYDYLVITQQIQQVVGQYLNGVSMKEIGKQYNVSERTIAVCLEKESVDIRPVGKISKINQDIFESIDNELKAYTLGLIMSDGNVSESGNTISITLTSDDDYILEQINNELLEGKGNIVKSHKNDKKPRSVLQFNGKKIKQDLNKYGIVPNKTHKLYMLPKNIPENLYHHFIRGLFDGDGVCSFYTSHNTQKVRIGYCAVEENFTKDYRDFLCNTIGLKRNKLFNTGSCWQCSWASLKDINSFFNYIYDDAHIYLGRKYKKIKDFIQK